jgi:hypothetical protein
VLFRSGKNFKGRTAFIAGPLHTARKEKQHLEGGGQSLPKGIHNFA